MSEEIYQLTVKMYGPVHIGGGKVIRKQEYIYDQYKGLVSIVDGPKLVSFLKKHGKLQSYLRYLEKTKDQANLYGFLKDEKITKNEWINFVRYTERVNQGKIDPRENDVRTRNNQTNNRSSKPMNDLHLFVRNGRGEVYIPGSSIKGAMRMVLEQVKKPATAYHYLSISDSDPIDADKLAIYQKIDINKLAKPMPLYRECIEVGTVVTFTMKIDTEYWSITEIEKSIQNFYLNYWNKWFVGIVTTPGGKEFINNRGLPKVLHAQNKPTILFLGGGTGFPSKTTHYLTKPKERAQRDSFEILQKRFRNVYGKMKTMPKNVPLVMKATVDYSKNKWYQQGICMLEFTRMGEE